jgi:hypothetical protein
VRRYNAVTRVNFDLTCGFNLWNPRHLQFLFQYAKEFQPVVVVMAPPCTGLEAGQELTKLSIQRDMPDLLRIQLRWAG